MSGQPLYIECHGTGPDLCLLHGWGTHGGIWAPWVEALTATHRLHVIDLPGHGDSDPAEGFSLAAAVSRVRTTLRENGVTRLDICGWSLGGLVGLQLALSHPELVHRLVLIGSTPRFVTAPDWDWGVATDVLAGFAAQLEADATMTVQRFLALQAQGDDRARDTVRSLRDALGSRGRTHPASLRGALTVLHDTDLRAGLARLTTPVLWIGGQRDVLVHPAAIEWAAAQCPHGQAAIIPGAGHAPFVSHSEQVLSRLEEFCGHG
ncbi:MAG TPA: pimeloyl-[acyl-carrier protein] methyl ester esterase [Gammaproteobacteria bacterium]|nr:pimeloyl-[acyl-carrier protein] methyl ester esterase [Gammaproteobacteria bacterium]